MALSILNVSFPLAPVTPDSIGGAEAVLALIDAELTRRGHASLVCAPEGSRVAGRLIAVPRVEGAITREARRRAIEAHRDAIARALRCSWIDVIHLHGLDFLDYLPRTEVPVMVTLHLPPDCYPRAAFDVRGLRRICVSHSQRRACPAPEAIDAVVPNGVELGLYRPAGRRGRHALALGRICREKGFDIALRAARAAGVPLLLGGRAFGYPEHQRHWREEIEPLLDREHRYLGPLAGARKRQLLAEARCVLVTSRVAETSSLVAMEALASGTPVVGFRRGALPELVVDGVSGFLVDHEEELPAAIERAETLRPADCRASAEARASAAAMTDRYLETYQRLARRPRRRRQAAVDLSVIRRDQELAALAGEWDELCDRCPAATPFQRPAWLLAWRRQFGSAPLHTLALHRGGRLVGLVPLEIVERGTARLLRFVGTGTSDHLDALLEQDVDPSPVARHLVDPAAPWQTVELDGLPAGSPLLGVPVVDAADELVPSVPCPAARLPPPRRPGKLAAYRRRLARAGAVEWETETDGDPGGLVDTLFQLHAARWSLRGEPGVLDHPAVQRFHREVAAAFHRAGRLSMIALRVDGMRIAVLYGFRDHGRAYYYQSGFAPAARHLNPGTLMVGAAIDRAIDEGAVEFDFLRGCEPYKFEWGAAPRPSWTRRLHRGEEGTWSGFAGRSAM
jgi:CelD/BcsL family acetyltransferase involved in cellulose biosynthesis/glycosyltransferase involved in cell wall biosynthesis